MLHYLQNIQAIHEGYLKAKVFQTPLQNDHVRYSWLVSVGVLLSLLLWNDAARSVKILLIVIGIWLVVYLHLLAARTGLASFYIMLFLYALFLVISKSNIKTALVVLSVIIIFPLLAWLFLPTFQNRIKYFVYDYSFIKSNTYLPGSNDGNRMLSLKAGWAVLQNHPGGVGRGDVYDETSKWYMQNIPGMQQQDRLYPASEWLLYGASAGWIGAILFTVSLVIPFIFSPPNNRFFWMALQATAAFSFAFDIGLEVQFGVFIYSFIVLWWWKWFALKNESAVHER
jgi:O-antigen ligase